MTDNTTIVTSTETGRPFAACKCGARVYTSQAEASKAEPNGLFKCPVCHTFALDHVWSWGDDEGSRCGDCDTRSHSHGRPATIADVSAFLVALHETDEDDAAEVEYDEAASEAFDIARDVAHENDLIIPEALAAYNAEADALNAEADALVEEMEDDFAENEYDLLAAAQYGLWQALTRVESVGSADEARAQHEREGREYRALVASLDPEVREAWAEVEERNEFFDGEWWAALGTLQAWLAEGAAA